MLISSAVPMSMPSGTRDHASVTVRTACERDEPELESLPDRLTQMTVGSPAVGGAATVEVVVVGGVVDVVVVGPDPVVDGGRVVVVMGRVVLVVGRCERCATAVDAGRRCRAL